MLQVGLNKGTECNEMRNVSLNVIVVTRVERNTEQTALMDYGNYLPALRQGVFFCGIHWNLTDSSISETSKWNRKSSDQYRYRIEAEIQY